MICNALKYTMYLLYLYHSSERINESSGNHNNWGGTQPLYCIHHTCNPFPQSSSDTRVLEYYSYKVYRKVLILDWNCCNSKEIKVKDGFLFKKRWQFQFMLIPLWAHSKFFSLHVWHISCSTHSKLSSFHFLLILNSALSYSFWICSFHFLLIPNSAHSIFCSFHLLLIPFLAHSIYCLFHFWLIPCIAYSILSSFHFWLILFTAYSIFGSFHFWFIPNSANSIFFSFQILLNLWTNYWRLNCWFFDILTFYCSLKRKANCPVCRFLLSNSLLDTRYICNESYLNFGTMSHTKVKHTCTAHSKYGSIHVWLIPYLAQAIFGSFHVWLIPCSAHSISWSF